MDAILCRPVTQGMLNRRFPKLGFHGAYDPHFIVRGKSGNQVSCTEDFFKEWCCAFLCFAKFCGNLGRQIPGKPMCRFADGAKQVVPLSLQNKFCPHKGHLPTAVQRSDVHRCFASRKRSPGNRTTNVQRIWNTNEPKSFSCGLPRTNSWAWRKNPFPTSPWATSSVRP